MGDTWTVSEWSIGDAEPAAFVDAFRRFADAATQLGGAREGMILHDAEDPGHFVIVRRWDDPDTVERWASVSGDHGGELISLVPEGGHAKVMTKVADLIARAALEAQRRLTPPCDPWRASVGKLGQPWPATPGHGLDDRSNVTPKPSPTHSVEPDAIRGRRKQPRPKPAQALCNRSPMRPCIRGTGPTRRARLVNAWCDTCSSSPRIATP